jgi:hypothetical protein
MQTPMTRHGDSFEAVLAVPEGARLDCGFLITRRRGISNLMSAVWDGACGNTDGRDVLDVASQVRLDTEYLPFLPGIRECSVAAAAAALLWLLLFLWFSRKAARMQANVSAGI